MSENSGPDRGRRLAQQQRAYELQLIGGLQVSRTQAVQASAEQLQLARADEHRREEGAGDGEEHTGWECVR